MTVYRMKLKKDKEQIASEMRTWGSSAHCLYTISLSLAVERLFDCGRNGQTVWTWVFVLFFLAFLTDCRKYIFEREMKKEAPLNFPWQTML